MSRIIFVKTQDELAAALIEQEKSGAAQIVVELRGEYFEVTKGQVTAYGSSQVTACGSSQVRACDSSQVTAYGSSQVTAYGSSQVRAYGSSQVTAYGSSQVRATPHVAVTVHGKLVKTEGGVLIPVPRLDTPRAWCEFYGVPVQPDDTVILYKGVMDDYRSPRGISYAPGTVPAAPDWDGGREECGGGLHFSPQPFMTLCFAPEAKRFVACPVALSDIAVHPAGSYPEKVKAAKCCAPVWECDEDGAAVPPLLPPDPSTPEAAS